MPKRDCVTYTVRPVEWDSPEAEHARQIRFKVFVDEQKVPAEEELDSIDPVAFHVIAYNEQGKACGTARLFTDPGNSGVARVGRMAVLAGARGTGCGGALLSALIAEAKLQGYAHVILSAQLHALGFYEKHGFAAQGDVYEDAGIPHKTMIRLL